MQIRIVREESTWQELSGAWNSLLENNHISSPFLRHEFQRVWWQGMGGGEWSQGELFILTGYDDQENLRGIAPFFIAPNEGLRQLMLIGSHEIADFLDFICSEDDLEAFVGAVLDYLIAEVNDEWDVLNFYNLLSDSHTLEILENATQVRGLNFASKQLQSSPFIPIPADLDAYLESLSSRTAKEMRRKMRRAASYPVPIELEIVTEAEDYEQCMGTFFELMGREQDKAEFLSGAMEEQMHLIAKAACENGWAQLAFLKIGDNRAAGYLNFDYQGRIWAYNSGFDPTHADLSPGWLLMAKLIEWCAENGKEVFDFMRGDEGYKYQFGGQDRFVWQAEISK